MVEIKCRFKNKSRNQEDVVDRLQILNDCSYLESFRNKELNYKKRSLFFYQMFYSIDIILENYVGFLVFLRTTF